MDPPCRGSRPPHRAGHRRRNQGTVPPILLPRLPRPQTVRALLPRRGSQLPRIRPPLLRLPPQPRQTPPRAATPRRTRWHTLRHTSFRRRHRPPAPALTLTPLRHSLSTGPSPVPSGAPPPPRSRAAAQGFRGPQSVLR